MAEDNPVRRFYDYKFDEDTRFHEGLTVMKRHISTEAASNTSWLLKAKVFYYSKFIEPISLEECLGARNINTLDRDDGEVVASTDLITTLSESMQNFRIDNEESLAIGVTNIVPNDEKRTEQHSVEQIVTTTAQDSDNLELTPNNDPDEAGRKIPDSELIISSSSDDNDLENVAKVCLVTNAGSVTTVPAEQVNDITSSDSTSHTTVPAEQVNVISSSDGTPPRVQTEQYNAITSSVGTPQPAVQTEQVNVISSSDSTPQPTVQTEQYNVITSSVGTPQPTVPAEQLNVISSSDGTLPTPPAEQVNVISSSDGTSNTIVPVEQSNVITSSDSTPPTVPAEQINIITRSDDMSDSTVQAYCHNDEPTEAQSGITDDKHSRLNTGDNSEAKSAPSEAPFVNENSGTDVFNLSSVEESLTFAEIINYVQKGEQIPGLLDLNIQPTNLTPTQSSATRKCKPWERDIIQP